MSQVVNAYLVSIVSGYCVSRKKPRRIVRGVRVRIASYMLQGMSSAFRLNSAHLAK